MRYVLIGLSTRALAESAVKAGRDIVSVDFFGDVDQEQICTNIGLRREYGAELDSFDPSLFLKAASRLEFDGAIYVAPLENHLHVLERLEKHSRIMGNEVRVVKEVRDWKRVREFCKENDIQYPQTVDGRGLIVKPKKSGGGVGIHHLSRYVVQRYIKGNHYSVSLLGNGEEGKVISVNEQLLGRKEFGARNFWYCGNITPVDVGRKEVIESMCENVVAKFRLKGSCGLDFVLDKGIWLMEINPRPQATLEIVEKAYMVNMFALHTTAVEGTLERVGRPKRTWGKAIIYAEKEVKMPDTDQWSTYGWIKDIPHSGEIIKKGEPLCTVLADGSDRDDCLEYLNQRAHSLKEHLEK
jgi:predicted ATP-grasp superfamily ATP-dependent carboligase